MNYKSKKFVATNYGNTFSILSSLSTQNQSSTDNKPSTILKSQGSLQTFFYFRKDKGGNYFYKRFAIPTHYNNNEIKSDSDTTTPKFKSLFNFKYNIFNKQYFTFLQEDQSIQEIGLPNFYYLIDIQYEPPKNSFDSLVNIFNNPKILKTFLDKNSQEFKRNIQNTRIINFDDDNTLIEAISKSTFENYKFIFPSYCDININTHAKNLNSFPREYISSYLFRDLCDHFAKTDKKDTFSFAQITIDGNVQNNTILEYIQIDDLLHKIAPNQKDPIQFFNKLKKFVIDNTLTIEQMISGIECYSEILGYRICKYDSNAPNAKPLQEWRVPNHNLPEVLKLVDTQIKYDKQYYYKIFLLCLVLEPKISLTPINDPPKNINKNTNPDNMYYNISIENNFNVYQINSAEYTNRLLENPPTIPNIEFVPYRESDNKIKIILQEGPGELEVEPITIYNGEQNKLENYKKAQESVDEKIKFSNIGQIQKFEVYRLPDPPKSYSDFANGKKFEIPIINGTATAIEDNTLLKNKKYYYTYRCTNFHGGFSNPGYIYEVELINDGGNIFPNIKIYDIDNIYKNYETASKYFNSKIFIEPTIANTVLDVQSSNINYTNESSFSGVKIGVREDPVWDKKFKIRLTSKLTGKKIDINLIFNVLTAKI